MYVVDIEPVRHQYRSLFRHHSPVPVRYETDPRSHGYHDHYRLESVGSHQHPATDGVVEGGINQGRGVRGQSRYRIPGQCMLFTQHFIFDDSEFFCMA